MESPSTADAEVAVRLRKPHFRLLWCTSLLTRLACIVFLGCVSRLYWFMAHPYMSYYAELLGPTAYTRFQPIGAAFGLIALAHAYCVLETIFYSVRLRKLVLDTNRAKLERQTAASQQSKYQSRYVSQSAALSQAQKTVAAGWRKLFSRRGLFGVESDFFHARFLFREIIEYISQTFQVYRSSILIAKPWINNLYVGLMVINCWMTPLLQRGFERKPAVERLLCLASDLVLDAASSMFIPLVIFAPYYQSFDFGTYNFQLVNLYDDLWFSNMVMENQQIFALTKWDFVFKILPHLSIYSCLGCINVLVRPKSSSHIASIRAKIYCGPSEPPAINQSERQPLPRGPSKRYFRKLSTEKLQPPPPGNMLGRWGMVVSHIGLFLWGLTVLVLHLLATKTSQSIYVPACKQPIRPWFATKYSCSVMNFNCHRNGSTGVSEDAFDYLEESSLVALVISHCPELRVPASIRRFHNLLGVDIYNSTIIEWREEAAITRADHPSLTYIIFVRVNMTELPPGVLQQLPDTMADFEISVSNLTALPSDLHTRWHPMALFYVEHTQIREFPSTLLELSVDDLSLVGNSIEVIPEFPADHSPKFVALALSHNPLTSLPTSLGDTSDLGFLSIDETLVATLPRWVDSVKRSATSIHAFNTPFCLSKSEAERASQFGPDAVLTCSDTNARSDGKYPLKIMALKRLI